METVNASQIHHVYVSWYMCLQSRPCQHGVSVLLRDGRVIRLGNQLGTDILRLMAAASDVAPKNAWSHMRYLWEDQNKPILLDMKKQHAERKPITMRSVTFVYDVPGITIKKPAVRKVKASASAGHMTQDDVAKYMREMEEMI